MENKKEIRFKVGDLVIVSRIGNGNLSNLPIGTRFKITSLSKSIIDYIGWWCYWNNNTENGISINLLELDKSQTVKQILDNL